MKIEINATSITIDGIEYEKKEQPTPKDGEVWYVKVKSYNQYIFTYKSGCGGSTRKYFGYSIEGNNLYLDFNLVCYDHEIESLRPATPEEIALLHTKLAEQGKVWNAEKKQLEDYRELKVGELVIGFNNDKLDATIARLRIQKCGHYFDCPYLIGDNWYKNAIPFESIEQYREFIKS